MHLPKKKLEGVVLVSPKIIGLLSKAVYLRTLGVIGISFASKIQGSITLTYCFSLLQHRIHFLAVIRTMFKISALFSVLAIFVMRCFRYPKYAISGTTPYGSCFNHDLPRLC